MPPCLWRAELHLIVRDDDVEVLRLQDFTTYLAAPPREKEYALRVADSIPRAC